MKSKFKTQSHRELASLLTVIVLASPYCLHAGPIIGDTVTTSLTVNGDTTGNGWGLFKTGVYIGPNKEAMSRWYPETTTPEVSPGIVSFDIFKPQGVFTWRQSPTTNSPVTKMSIDANNVLSLYKADGNTVGLTFDPNSGITLSDGTRLDGAASLRSTALYDANGNMVASVASDGKVKFTNGITFGTDANVKLNASNVAALQSTLTNLGYQENPVIATAVKKIGLTGVTVTSVATQGNNTSGNLYVAGYFTAAANIAGSTVVSAGSSDGFIASLNSGGGIQWVKTIGGALSDSATSVSVDSSGSIFVTGNFQGTTTTLGTSNLTSVGSNDGYVVKFDTDGNIQWAKQIGGISDDSASSVSTDGDNNILVVGNFQGATTTLGNYNIPSTGGSDGYVAMFDWNGNVQWAKQIGGIADDSASSVSVDGNDNILVAGSFQGAMSSIGASSITSAGSEDGYVAKFHQYGGVQWAKPIGGVSTDVAGSITVDGSGNVFVAGNFTGSTTNLPGANLTATTTSITNGYVAKLNYSTGGVEWAKSIGSSTSSKAVSVRLDSIGNATVGGVFHGTVTNLGTTSLSSAGSSDVYVARFNGASGAVVDSLAFGGSNADWLGGVLTWGSDVYAWGSTATSLTSSAASSFNFGNTRITRGGFLVGWPALSVVTPATVSNNKLSWGGSAALSSGATALGGTAFAGGLNSVALGNGISTGNLSLSSGGGIASGNSSVALGIGTAMGANSVVLGSGIASGANSVVLGSGIASGANSVVLGAGTASGSWSIAAGPQSTASGQVSLAGGGNQASSPVDVTGVSSIAWGQKLNVSGTYAQAFGFGSSTTGSSAAAFGRNNTAQSFSSFVLGSYGLSKGNPLSWIPTDDLFVVANGDSTTATSSAITTLKNGQTTLINKQWKAAVTAAPGNTTVALANPSTTTDSDGNALVVDGHAVLNGKVIISVPQGDISMGIYQ